jgi:fatty-acyl-CoA synthase
MQGQRTDERQRQHEHDHEQRGLPSHVRGATDVPLLDETIGALFERIAERYADNDALVVAHQRVRWTYGELARRVDDLAVGFMRLNLLPGERIGIWSHDCAEWVLTQFAAAKAGLILVNLNPAYRPDELEHALNKAACKALVVAPRCGGSDTIRMLTELAPELAICAPGGLAAARLPALETVIRLGAEPSPGMFNFEELLAPASARERLEVAVLGATLSPDAPVNIQYTSGTTGAPKGATLTHLNLVNNGFFVGEALQLTEADRLCIPVPLYHAFGMVLGNLAAVSHGATIVLPGERFDASAVLATVEVEQCTVLYGVPSMFIAMLDAPGFEDYDLATLRTGIMAGAPCPVEVVRRVATRMSLPQLTLAYGMTETSPVSFQSALDDPHERRVATVGRVQPHVEAKVVDARGVTVPRGETGELLTRGYSVMPGYWNDPRKTSAAIDADGWMHTGDLATLDDAGYCRIVGRAADRVMRGGEIIHPREIEELLHRHPKVKDVQCVGVPDADHGEALCACVVLKAGIEAGEEEIRAFCRERVAPARVPRHVMFMSAFPMTVTGKIQKYVLRRRIADALDEAEEEPAC